jgi:hypothetical protein
MTSSDLTPEIGAVNILMIARSDKQSIFFAEGNQP